MKFLVLLALSAAAAGGCFPTFSARLTWPARVSVELGISTHDTDAFFSVADGFVLRVEPGLSGGKIHAGLRSQFTFLFLPLMTWDYTLSVYHTWNRPWGGLADNQTYLGMEAQTKINFFLMSAGVYWHVAGDEDDPRALFSGGVGAGF